MNPTPKFVDDNTGIVQSPVQPPRKADHVTLSEMSTPSMGRTARSGVKPLQEMLPQHKQLIWMKAKGLTAKEMSNATGVPMNTIYQVMSAPWFAQELRSVLRECGIEDAQEVIAIYAREAIDLCHQSMLTEENATIRQKYLFKIVDLGYGQKVDITHHQSGETPEELAANISRLKEDIEMLTQGAPTSKNRLN